MESPTAPVAAPAQPAAPEPTVSATFDAASKGDFAAFDTAHVAARSGKPLPDVAAPIDATAAPTERTVSKRQQQINDSAQRAVDAATQTLRDENASLKAQLAGRTAPPAEAPRAAAPPPAAPAPPATEPEWKRISALPDAPKLTQFESVEEHAAAMAVFVTRQLQKEGDVAARTRADADALTASQKQRVDTFVGRLRETATADPEFVNKLTPEVKAIKPFGGLAPGEASGPINVIGEQIYDSPIAPQILLHLSQHPEALTALTTMPTEIAALAPQVRTKAHIGWMVKQFGKLEGQLEQAAAVSAVSAEAAPSPISAAPPPPPTLTRAATSTDSQAAAVKRGDFEAFDRIEMEKRRARLTRA